MTRPERIIYTNRRLTFGASKEQAVAQVDVLIPPEHRDSVRVEILHYDTPSYTDYQYSVEKYFPAWAIEEDHPLVQAGLEARQALWREASQASKWDFSTTAFTGRGKPASRRLDLRPVMKGPSTLS